MDLTDLASDYTCKTYPGTFKAAVKTSDGYKESANPGSSCTQDNKWDLTFGNSGGSCGSDGYCMRKGDNTNECSCFNKTDLGDTKDEQLSAVWGGFYRERGISPAPSRKMDSVCRRPHTGGR